MNLVINGKSCTVADDDAMLIDVVRNGGLTGTKLVCGGGVCGACTVLLDDKPVVSCLMPAKAARDRQVTTVEGIGVDCIRCRKRSLLAMPSNAASARRDLSTDIGHRSRSMLEITSCHGKRM